MAPLDDTLTGLAAEGASGALRVGRMGTLFLTGGRVTYGECVTAVRLEDLLVAAGRGSRAALRRAIQGEGPGLVEQGVVSRGELQYCALLVTMDAAFFLLPAATGRPKFVPGERHWLSPQWYFEVTGLLRECRRRRAALEQAWPSAEFDGRPVVPAARLPGHHVVLSALQWEILTRADGQATPLELARRLGRPAFTVLLAVRRMAAEGLLDRPPDGEGRAALPRRPRTGGPPPPPPTGHTDLAVLLRLRKALEELA
ncbi:MarR family transcriptional regulator [Thermoactinospora rubra]|uniref:MarR family transcriptional regulator n=1 Tax=Thermoactinospora rubra TaxID=1088767 RepID=UPI000A117635|nr:MarR family transcriptional regulator [Thermoactinospora rubra]